MASLKDLRKRVASVKSTQQITKAMKMVAAARLRRAQEAAERARPYADKLSEMFRAVVADLDEEAHALLARREERRVDVVVLTSDRGLCGGYNTNVLRLASSFLREKGATEISLYVVGRKGLEYFRRRGPSASGEKTGVANEAVVEIAREIGARVTQRFADGETDAVYLVYSRFRSAIAQVPSVVPLLPVPLAEDGTTGATVDYIFEPPRTELLGTLLPRYIEAQVLQALLESQASELGARMTAMDNATRNASEMIDRLTLQMNRVRQTTITTELMEIVSGAEALKG